MEGKCCMQTILCCSEPMSGFPLLKTIMSNLFNLLGAFFFLIKVIKFIEKLKYESPIDRAYNKVF